VFDAVSWRVTPCSSCPPPQYPARGRPRLPPPAPTPDRPRNKGAPRRDNAPALASAASLVVCGVDGTVYTLDAHTCRLRGMFDSGSTLVSSAAPGEDAAPDQGAAQGRQIR
jgi:hypothetical protein